MQSPGMQPGNGAGVGQGMVLIGEIYDAGFDPARFPALLERLTGHFDASSAFLGWVDEERDAGFQAQFGNDPAWMASYAEKYNQHDVLLPHLLKLTEGDIATAHPLLQQPDIRAGVFYREYLAPQAIVDNMAAVLVRRPGISAHISFLRRGDAPPFDDQDIARMRDILPHLTRAVFVQSRLIRDSGLAQGYRQASSVLSGSLLQLSHDHGVVDMDADLAGVTGLRIGDVLRRGPFADAVRETIADGQPHAAELTDGEGAPLRLLCEARPVPRDRFADLVSGSATAFIVHVTLIDRPRQIAWPAMAALYRLTPTEARVLQDAVEHSDLTEIGDRLGMARATARAHLHRIYAKTDTGGFAGLTGLAHRFAMAGPVDS